MNGAAIKVEQDGAVDMITFQWRNVTAYGTRLRATGEIAAWRILVGRRDAGRMSALDARAAVGLRGLEVAAALKAIEKGRI